MYVVSGSDDGTARVWEAATGKEVARMTYDDWVWVVAFSPDGKYVASGSTDNTARVWEVATGKEVARMTHDSSVPHLAFSPDGKYVISGSYDRTARVWEAATGKEVARMTHDDNVNSVAFSPDGKYVASGSEKTARIWNWQPDDLIFQACAFLPRNLTRAEWDQYMSGALSYQAVCPNLPLEPDPTPVPSATPSSS
jgi:WD40 repeat protein